MKKLLIALVFSSLLVLGIAVSVMADNGPHGGFTATTDACASCHRAHSAQYGSNALLISNPETLCMSCHDGTGAGTNVHDGVYSQAGSNTYNGAVEGTDGASLFAGGFVNTLMATAWSGAVTANPLFNAVSRPASSVHNVSVSGTVWGSGIANSPNGALTLECTSCHDPHGKSGWDVTTTPDTKVASYRLLRWQPQGSGGFTPPAAVVNWSGGAFPVNDATTPVAGWLVPDNFAALGTEWYTIGTTAAFAVGDYNAGNANNVYNTRNPAAAGTATYIPAATNTAYFCAQCHDRYFANSRLRNNTDASVFCGAPVAGVIVNGITLPVFADADGVAPWIHPTQPTVCEPVISTTTGLLTGWGDNRSTGDTVYTFMHSSGDVLRTSMDGTYPIGAGTSVSRSCVACHVSHGTSAQMTAFASDATVAIVAGADVNNSTLLRMDNRSVCLRCHATTVNFTVGP